MGVVLRPPTEEDVPLLVELMNALPRAFHGKDDMSEEELRHWLGSPTVDIQRDIRVAERGGTVLAYADIEDQSELHTGYWLYLCHDPHRAEASDLAALVEWAEGRSRSNADPGARLRAILDPQDVLGRQVVEQAGLALIRHSYRMAIELEGAPPEPSWPEGIEVRTFREEDARLVYEVHQETFADAWEHTTDPFDEWSHWLLEREGFDPTLWWIASEAGEVAAVSLCRRHDSLPDTGWVNVLGVRRAWRRRGLGRALLEHAFAEFARRGYQSVGLGVDADSLTGAHRLYEAAGMRVVRTRDIYEKPLG